MNTLNNITEIAKAAAVIIPSVVAIFLAVREVILNKFRPRYRSKSHQNISKIYFELNKIVATGAKRAVILTAEPPPSRYDLKVFGHVKYEIFEHPLPSFTTNWQRQFLTVPYKKFLMSLQEKHSINLITENLELPILKSIFESEGVFKALVFYIKTDKNKMIYLSINYTKDIIFTAKETTAINSAVNNLRNIFNDDDKL